MKMNKKHFFSIVIPVYNRPHEIDELINSLMKQTYKNFEIIVVEDGSRISCHNIVKQYEDFPELHYFYKENTGPGDTRNYGARKAHGDYIIFFDSDCIIPASYFEELNKQLQSYPVDAFGGPDMSHPSFTPIQKAISYSMTAFLTTGGIRGAKSKITTFYPRSFNMGVKPSVFKTIGGFSQMRFGEDLDFSMRLVKYGYSTKLFNSVAVFHKRRTDFKKFFKQVYNSGIARINLQLLHPGSLKIIHAFPSLFSFSVIAFVFLSFFYFIFIFPVLLYIVLVFFDSLIKEKSMLVALASVISAFIQHFAYGTGFIKALISVMLMKKKLRHAFVNNLYD